jgi:hypothetical protein
MGPRPNFKPGSWRAYSRGVIPVVRRKMRVKWLWSQNPSAAARSGRLLVLLCEVQPRPLDAPAQHVGHRAVAGAQSKHPREVEPAHASDAGERAQRQALADVFLDVGHHASHRARVQPAALEQGFMKLHG